MNEWGLFWGSVLAGFITGFHCVGMCGPLSCALVKTDSITQKSYILIQYHFGRVISYGLLGMIAGALGSTFFEGIPMKPLKVLGWFFIAVYFILAWGWELKMSPGSWEFKVARWTYPWVLKFKNRSGFSLGLVTPLMPCTPLYLSSSAAFLSGNGLWGMWIMIGFVLGTVPIYGVSQHFWLQFQSRLSFSQRNIFRRGLALVAVFIMGWRMYTGEFMNAAQPCHQGGFPCIPVESK